MLTIGNRDASREEVARVARESQGRLLACLAASCRDIAAAEDALSEAFLEALENWPRAGLPDRPEGWLLTTARRRLLDAARRDRIGAAAFEGLRPSVASETPNPDCDGDVPDERLKLLFACAHPSVDAGARTPLMLQAVLGLDASRISSAFLVSPAAMSQRLVRAKAKLRDFGARFEVSEGPALPERLDSVLEAVYVAYGCGWGELSGKTGCDDRVGLTEEAIFIGRLIARMMPAEPEAGGLLSLMLFCESRRAARRGPRGEFVPLAHQDRLRWSRPMIEEAEASLRRAAAAGRIGRYQLEAAIQSAHAAGAYSGSTDWEAVALLYEGLVRCSPTVGALVGRASAIAEARGPASGLAALEEVSSAAVTEYQPYWALAGHLLADVGRPRESRSALERAAGLTEDPAVRAYLLGMLPR